MKNFTVTSVAQVFIVLLKQHTLLAAHGKVPFFFFFYARLSFPLSSFDKHGWFLFNVFL